jgi:hypothetical protein
VIHWFLTATCRPVDTHEASCEFKRLGVPLNHCEETTYRAATGADFGKPIAFHKELLG